MAEVYLKKKHLNFTLFFKVNKSKDDSPSPCLQVLLGFLVLRINKIFFHLHLFVLLFFVRKKNLCKNIIKKNLILLN